MITKEQKLLKKVLEKKTQISKLQEDLNLIYDKLRSLDIPEVKLDGYGKITAVHSTITTYDTKGLEEEIGKDIMLKYARVAPRDFFRVTFDKNYFKNVK